MPVHKMGGKKHITSACMNCRRRKVKCDGNEPCSNCSASKLTCEYNPKADMRKVSSKKLNAELQARVAQLEDTLRQQGMQHFIKPSIEDYEPKSGGEQDDENGANIYLDLMPTIPIVEVDTEIGTDTKKPPPPKLPPPNSTTPGETHRHQGSVGSEASEHYNRSNSGPSPPTSGLFDLVEDQAGEETAYDLQVVSNPRGSLSSSGSPQSVKQDTTTSALTSDFIKNISCSDPNAHEPTIPEDTAEDDETVKKEEREVDDSLENMLAARMGSLRIAEDGQLRYYGPTSNLHGQPSDIQYLSLLKAKIRHVSTDGAHVLRKLGLDQVVPLEIEIHLAKLYFAWEDPAVRAIDEEVYFEEKLKWAAGDYSSPYYSDTLNNAVCALGACFAVDEEFDLPEPASEFFVARAKALLDIEMDSPTVATVQALVIMSAAEAAWTRDTRGWVYSGTAARLSADLGLHLDVTKDINAGVLTQRDLDIRTTAFWGVVIHELMWSFYVGRPSGLGVRTVSVLRPDGNMDQLKGRMWKPYPKPAESLIPDEGLYFPREACTDATITLCQFMAKINSTLHSGRPMDLDEQIGFLARTKQALYAWRSTLDESLEVDLADSTRLYVPPVLQLHMQFYALLCSLHRPFMSSIMIDREEGIVSESNRQTLRDAPNDCVAAAHQTTEYLRCYQRQHYMPRPNIQVVHIIFTASPILIYDTYRRTGPSSRASLRDLQFCLNSLDEIGRCFGNATRAMDIVLSQRRHEQLRAVNREAGKSSTKRSRGSISGSISNSSKGEDLLKDEGACYEDRNKRRYSSTVVNPVPPTPPPQPFSAFQVLDQYVGDNTYTTGLGFDNTGYDHDIFMGMSNTADMNFDSMLGQPGWFDPMDFYPEGNPPM